jgi:uncharacterized repeat protein (TIGR03803 family)
MAGFNNSSSNHSKFHDFQIFAIALLALGLASASTPALAQYSLLYSFGRNSGTDAANPLGPIAQGEDGSLYSTALNGGANDWGAIFKVSTAGKEKVLYSFCSLAECADGDAPSAGLTLRPDGHFHGAVGFSAGFTGPGNIFDVSETGTLTTLYTLSNSANGATPLSPILGPDGQFYGVASSGGNANNCGTVYRLISNVYTVIHTFDGTHGCSPAGLVLGTDGSFYGTTTSGGTAKAGVVFKLTYVAGKSNVFTVLTNLTSTYGPPVGSLVEGNDGDFYGVTTGNQAQEGMFGSVFQVTPAGVLTTLHALNGSTDGAYPAAGLAFGSDGNFYGTTQVGGGGTLFQVTPAGGFSVLFNFDTAEGNDGYVPTNLVQHTNGLFYGVTTSGGSRSGIGTYNCGLNIDSGCGVFYSWNAGLSPFVSSVQLMGAVESSVEILGQGFDSSTTVSFNGTPASVRVQSGEALSATVPAGATTGSITVTTSTGTLTSNRQFIVTP